MLPYAAPEDHADRSIHRGCAAAMVAAGVTQGAGFARDLYYLFMFSGVYVDDIVGSMDTYFLLSMIAGVSALLVVAAGVQWWRGRARRLALWSLAAWAISGAAVWAFQQADNLMTGLGPTTIEELPNYAADLLASATPMVLPVLLWWIVRGTSPDREDRKLNSS